MRLPVLVCASFSVLLFGQPASKFKLTVGSLSEGSSMPRQFTCDGKNVSPALNWSGEPEGTQSFALVVEDPDARNFNHWVMWDIPPSVHALAEGAKPEGV